MAAKWLLWTAFLSAAVNAQEAPLEVRGEVQYSWLSGTQNGHGVTKGDAGRALLNLSKGPWEVTGGYFFYPLCDFNMFDETTVAYHFNGNRIRFGRFMPKISQSNWYDQWNSGFVFLPDIEHWVYFGELSLWQTTPGVELELPSKNATLTLTAMDNDGYDHNYLTPRRYNRQSARVETFQHNVVIGAAAYWDFAKFHDGQHLGGLDFRTSGNHWVLRGQGLMGNKYDAFYRGFFTDLAVRPPGQDKLTLLGRYESSRYEYGGGIYREYGLTLGAKYALPQQWTASVNYIHGSFQPPMNYGRGWVFGLEKTIAF